MKKFLLLLSGLILTTQVAMAQDFEHHVAKANKVTPARADYTLSRFTVCNKLSYPVFFISWAIDTPDSYRYNDWIAPYECRTDKFDRYFDIALYEFATEPYKTPFLDYVLRNGQTLNLTPYLVEQFQK